MLPRRSSVAGILSLIAILLGSLFAVSYSASAQEAGAPDSQPVGEAGLYRTMALQLVTEALTLIDGASLPTLGPYGDMNADVEALAMQTRGLDPSLGDGAALLAGSAAGRQSMVLRREELLRNALELGTEVIDRTDVVKALADLLTQRGAGRNAMRLIEEALGTTAGPSPAPLADILGGLSAPDGGVPRVSGEMPSDPLLRAYVEAMIITGPEWVGSQAIRRLRSRYPADVELASWDLARFDRVSIALLEWLEDARRRGWTIPPDLLIDALLDDPDGPAAGIIVEQYALLDGSDPVATVLEWTGRRRESVAAGLRPVEEIPASDKLAWELAYNRTDGDLDTLPSALSARLEAIVETQRDRQSLELELDEDRDSFWEERYTVRDGRLVAWQTDADENGRIERAVTWSDESTRYLQRADGSAEVYVVEFRPYPLASAVYRIERQRTVEWLPARPVPFPIGLESTDESGDAPTGRLWRLYGARISVSARIAERFSRQVASDDARVVSAREHGEWTEYIERWGRLD
jgi:hypothetical protein